MRYFIEPVALAAGYAKTLGYKNVVMVGLSGGGWTTTVAAGVVTDIDLSFPTAGSTPKWPTKAYAKWVPDLPEGHNRAATTNIFVPPPQIGAGGDYEQNIERPMWDVAGGCKDSLTRALSLSLLRPMWDIAGGCRTAPSRARSLSLSLSLLRVASPL